MLFSERGKKMANIDYMAVGLIMLILSMIPINLWGTRKGWMEEWVMVYNVTVAIIFFLIPKLIG